jgi:hypothetical protein
MEEDMTPPRRNDTLLLDGMRATRSSYMRFTESQGHTKEPPVPPRHSTRSSASPPYAPRYSDGFIIMTEEEKKKVTRLEKRLVANIDFDDQALHILGFHTDILDTKVWVQFSNGVSVNTHKEFALEILMTMAHILDEGVPSFSFCLEGVEQVVPYDIRELLGFQKGAPEQVDVHAGTFEGVWSMIEGEDHQ